MPSILIIEDDPTIRLGLEMSLRAEGYDVSGESDGQFGLTRALRDQPDLLLLDLMLPSKNGYDICRELRARQVWTPVLLLTSKTEEIDKVAGFESGADDYLTKPFSLAELFARVKALLRRSASDPQTGAVTFGEVVVHPDRLELQKNGVATALNLREMQILQLFLSRQHQVITRDTLLDEVWGEDKFPTSRTIDNYIVSLRKKIENNPAEPQHILTVHNVGYKFVP